MSSIGGMGDDWLWIGLGAAAVIGAIAIAKPLYETGENIAGATDIINPNWWMKIFGVTPK